MLDPKGRPPTEQSPLEGQREDRLDQVPVSGPSNLGDIPYDRPVSRRAPSALDDPGLLAAAREIEDRMLWDGALNGEAMRSAMNSDAFDATIAAFGLQRRHDQNASQMADLLEGPIASQLGEVGGRLDRLECGRTLCAAQYTVPGEVPPALSSVGSGISRVELVPGGVIYRTIFSTDPRVEGIRLPSPGG